MRLKTSWIEVRDTALGRYRETEKHELLGSIALMTEQEIKSVQQKINSVKNVCFLGETGEARESYVVANTAKAGQEESAVEASADE